MTLRRLAPLALVLALSSAAPASADPLPPVDLEGALDEIDQFMAESCSVDLCIPPWYSDAGQDMLHCAIYRSLAPGVPGVLDIDSEGDVSVGGRQVKDCPPYDGGAEFDLSDTYAEAVQLVCGVAEGAPPPHPCTIVD